jgi:hypothetical protein
MLVIGLPAQGRWHAFVFSNGVYTTIDVPGALWTAAFAISDSGQVFGVYYPSASGYPYSSGPEALFQYDRNTRSLTTSALSVKADPAFNPLYLDVIGISPTGAAVGGTSSSFFIYSGGETSLVASPGSRLLRPSMRQVRCRLHEPLRKFLRSFFV